MVEDFTDDMLHREVDPAMLRVRGEMDGTVSGSRRPVRTSPWPYLLILGVLCGEWTLRRRAGLR